MTGIVNELIDEYQALANTRIPWEKYWREITAYVLPQTEGFDRLVSSNLNGAMQIGRASCRER